MSTTSIAVERNKLPKHVVVEEPKVVKPREEFVTRTKFNLFMRSIYSEILDSIKSVLLIFAVLAVCKFSGLYDWWIQLIGNI